MLNAARTLSRRGYIVHPLCLPDHGCGPSAGKIPHSRSWNAGGVKTEQACRRIWGRHRKNLGVRVTSAFLVVDCDVDSAGAGAGLVELEQLYTEHDSLMPLPTLATGKRGAHFWLRVPADVPLLCNRKLAPHIDTRTEGLDKAGKRVRVGQVVVPPSLHQSGRSYAWLRPPPPITELLPAPPWMVERLRWMPAVAAVRSGHVPAPVEGADGWDAATSAYWRAACDGLAGQTAGGEGKQGRNTRLYALGATARRLSNAHGARITPGQAVMRQDAVAAGRGAGLPEEDLGRQFTNGWDAAGTEAQWPPEDPGIAAAAAQARAQQGSFA